MQKLGSPCCDGMTHKHLNRFGCRAQGDVRIGWGCGASLTTINMPAVLPRNGADDTLVGNERSRRR